MKHVFITLLLFCFCIPIATPYDFLWQIDETPEGQESATVVQPVQVLILDELIEIADNSASIRLLKKYSVHLGAEWDAAHAARLLQTFELVPQETNGILSGKQYVLPSVWIISPQHIQNDIEINFHGDVRIVTIAAAAFVHASPQLAEIEGVRGRYFSKRLHRAVVRFVTDGGNDRHAIKKILSERFDVSIDVPDYIELTRHTTDEGVGRFSEFKSEERIALVSMFEEFPTGMLKTPGLQYLVRRLDGTSHPLHPIAPAVAWTSAGYIEFMESAFKAQELDYIHRLILHEKAHFLWEHLFDEQLKEDWITLGGWFKNPNDVDGWSTIKQSEFVSAYAHAKNPDEDMAESISFYIVRPDKLRSRAPAKYEFIKNRIMHGTRYISQIREDLTFEVYNLYPDYVYPGRIIGVRITVTGGPEDDKHIAVELKIHRESEFDGVSGASIRVRSSKGTTFNIGNKTYDGDIIRGSAVLSRYAVGGYWIPDAITLWDQNGNERHSSQTDFGWKLHINNPLADCEPPIYVPNTMRLSLSQSQTSEAESYQVVVATWKALDDVSGIGRMSVRMNDTDNRSYSISADGVYDNTTQVATAKFKFADYAPSGVWSLNKLTMRDLALNPIHIYFTGTESDEIPQTIEVITKTPDLEPPVLDVNKITINAEPVRPDDPNGETIVDVYFYVKDNISGYSSATIRLHDPHGVWHNFSHRPPTPGYMYFVGDPTVFERYHKRIILPVGSNPGTWGLAAIKISDKAKNRESYDFTEIVRFEVTDELTDNPFDINGDGEVNILDLVLVANAFGESNLKADVNGDGEVNILDLVAVANAFGE